MQNLKICVAFNFQKAFMMFKFCKAVTFLICGAFFIAACASLPEGAQKPGLSIEQVSLENNEGKAAFALDVALSHNSLSALPLKKMQVTIFVNGNPAANYEENLKKVEVQPRETYHLKIKVDANLLPEVASRSLAFNRMVKVNASVMVQTIIDENKQNLEFNPTATFDGIIGHVQ